MRDLLRLGIAICLCLSVITACDEKEETTPPGEKAIKEIIEKLEELDGVTNFTAALKNIGSVNLENDQLTVFAVQDDGVKSTSGTKAGLSTSDIKRHIAKGKHDVTKFPNGEPKELESIAGDKIVIVNNNGVITINGEEIEVGTPVTVGNSIIFIVPDVIPVYDPVVSAEREINFIIRETNREWEEGQPDTFQSEGAIITLVADLDGDGIWEELGSVTTDANGVAVFSTSQNGKLHFRITKIYKTPFILGYRLAGLFTIQEEIDNSVPYETETFLDNKYLGSIMLVDVSGDGRVDQSDKTQNYLIQVDDEQNEVEVVMTDEIDIEINYEAALQRCQEQLPVLFRDILADAYMVDTSLVYGYAGFPTLSNIKDELEQLWHNSYAYIAAFNNNRLLFEDNSCPSVYRNIWKKEYFSSAARNVAYIYSILTNYWGEVPLVTSTDLEVPQVEIRDIASYIDIFIGQAAENEKYAIMAIQSRMLLNPDVKSNERAFANYREIIHSGEYKLSSDWHNITSDMQLMGFYDLLGDGISFAYPICLPEIYLGAADAALNLGMTSEAIEYVSIILDWIGEQPLSSSEPAQLRSILQDLSLRLLRNEDKTFMLYKRWSILKDKLSGFGFVDRNNLLPIPQSALNANKKLKQNPGYL